MADAGYLVERWESFAVAEVGASAALAGLLVVAGSINIARIIQLPAVINRLGATLTLFTGILFVGSLLLTPGLDRRLLGALIAVLGPRASSRRPNRHTRWRPASRKRCGAAKRASRR
jgi:modulator of FtsH protease